MERVVLTSMREWELFRENKFFSLCRSMTSSHFREQLKDVTIHFAYVVKSGGLSPHSAAERL